MISKRIIIQSICINAFFLGLCHSFGDLRFGANDDFFMAGILSGMYGSEYNIHLTFINALYGYCLLPFYYFFPKINWYYIGEMSSIFISLTIAGYIIIRKVGDNWGIVLTTLLVALYASDYYLVLQFTQCAAMLSAVGMLCIIYGFDVWNSHSAPKAIGIITVGIFLLWWGSWMRWPAYMMGMPFFAGILFLHVKKFWKIKGAVFITLLIAFLGAFAMQQFNNSLYRAPDYKRYMDFQGPRSLLGDGENYNQQAVYEDLEEQGFAGKDYAMLTHWTFYDKEVFAPESIQIVTNVISRYFFKQNLSLLPQMLLTVLETSVKSPIFIAWALLNVILLIFHPQKSAWTCMSLIIALSMIAYLLNLHRLVYRVETGLWLYATLLTIPLLKVHCKIPKITTIVTVLLILSFNLYLYTIRGAEFRSPNTGELISNSNLSADTVDYKGFLAYMDSMPDSIVFIMSMNSYASLAERKKPYLSEAKSSWERIFSFGYWTPYFPDVENALRKHGISNPIKEVIKENVLVVDEPSLVDFLERHHYSKVEVDTVRNFNGLVVYKYTTISDSLTEKTP